MLTIQDTQKIMEEIQTLYEKYGREDFSLAHKAYQYALQAHGDRKRRSGEPYIVHPVGAARDLIVIEPDLSTLVVALLHDTVSHGQGTFDDLEAQFGVVIRNMVEAIDRIGHMHYRGQEAKIDRMQRTMLSLAFDVRALFVKIADRISNLRIVSHYPSQELAREIAEESLSVYAPLAARLGLWAFKETIENLCLQYLEPEEYMHITGELANYTLELDDFLTNAVTKIKSIIPEKYSDSVKYRPKSVYSIFRKLRASGAKSIRDLYDIYALRIIVDDISECYHILGIVHAAFTPMSTRFKDFIAVPKPNGYQSLHTTVLGFYGFKQPIEIQIRTNEMHINAEKGTAKHVLYKIYGDSMQTVDKSKDLVQLAMDTLVDEEGKALEKKHQSPTVFVFSPKGDSFELPHNATPVDFAYAVHTNIGHHTVGARVNGRIATLDTSLQDGDVVEIITNPNSHPSHAWLDFAVSTKARSQISVEVKRLSGDRDRMMEMGKERLRTAFQNAGITLLPDFSNFWQYYGTHLDEKKANEFFYQIAQGMSRPSSFLPRKRIKKTPKTLTIPTDLVSDVVIGGEKQIPHEKAGCCTPVFPENIVALLRSGGRCMIHRADCPFLLRANPQRILPAYWRSGQNERVEGCHLMFHCSDDLLARIATILYGMRITIIEISASDLEDNISDVFLRLEIPIDNPSLIDRLIDRIRLEIPEFLGKSDPFSVVDNHITG